MTVKFADQPDKRDLATILKCECCGEDFHPRKTAHIASTRYCTPECARKCQGRNRF